MNPVEQTEHEYLELSGVVPVASLRDDLCGLLNPYLTILESQPVLCIRSSTSKYASLSQSALSLCFLFNVSLSREQ